ncbi:gamma-glutamylcyclotransferase isoform X1 [Castor canadensis]|uniref:Gamma-glutamylcyclotransferase isoform X1 n=1 Tax=Castor canadensis TaxID=51338 RepID=A0AC58LW17_CASCN
MVTNNQVSSKPTTAVLSPAARCRWLRRSALVHASASPAVQAFVGTWRTPAARTARARRRRLFYTLPMAAICSRRGSISVTPRPRSAAWPACSFLHIEGTQKFIEWFNCMEFKDFKLDFGNFQGKTSERWHGGIATIFQSPGDEVWGVVWKMNKSNLNSLDEQEGVKRGIYVVIEIKVSTQEGKEINCRSYLMTNYESAPPSSQYKKVICLGAKENGLPLEYQEKLKAIEPNDYKGKVSEEIEEIIKKGEAKLSRT